MNIFNFIGKQGQFETMVVSKGIRTFGFPSLEQPKEGDLFVTNRNEKRVLYKINSIKEKVKWDSATYEGLPEMYFWKGEMLDVVELKLWTPEMIRKLKAQGLA